jgi:hypothetical protein
VGGTAGPGTNYKVGIREVGTTDLDTSDAYFKISRAMPPLHKSPPPPVSLKVNVPDGGERWRIGTQKTITWSSSNLPGKVELVLAREPNIFIGVIASDLPPNGSHTWRVGDYQGGTTTEGQFRVRARWQSHPDRYDESDQTFTLTPLLPNMKPPRPFPGQPVRVPATILNQYGTDSHPNVGDIPMGQIVMGRPGCGASTEMRASVGRDWFPYQNVHLGVLYRSRVHFNVGPYADRAAQLTAARLRLKQLDSVRTGTTDESCGRSFGELLAPWTTFESAQITNPRQLHWRETEYTVDITETVRKWLNGTLPNHGLLLFAAESPMSNPWTCISCFEATFELEF